MGMSVCWLVGYLMSASVNTDVWYSQCQYWYVSMLVGYLMSASVNTDVWYSVSMGMSVCWLVYLTSQQYASLSQG